MSSWSSGRKGTYAFIMLVIIGLFIVVPSYYIFYTPPSCTDKIQNGTEQGIDCGGSCTKLCSSSFLPIPAPSWIRMRETAPGVYNVAAYIINPNQKVKASALPYKIELIDAQGFTQTTGYGTINIPAGRNTLAFASIKNTTSKIPVRAVFSFVAEPEWVAVNYVVSNIEVVDKNYSDEVTGSSLEVTLRNKGASSVRNVTVFAILKDKDDNVIDFSKTIVDEIGAMSTEIAPFTWPESHGDQVISIEVLPVAE